jgi:hypothetical protein
MVETRAELPFIGDQVVCLKPRPCWCAKERPADGQRIDLVVAERPRLLPWHSPPDVVEERRRIWPEIGDRLHRGRVVGYRSGADEWRRSHACNSASAVRAVTQRAFRSEDGGSLARRSGTRRQTRAIRLNADIPRGYIGLIDGPAEVGPVGKGGAGNQTNRKTRDLDGASMSRHA